MGLSQKRGEKKIWVGGKERKNFQFRLVRESQSELGINPTGTRSEVFETRSLPFFILFSFPCRQCLLFFRVVAALVRSAEASSAASRDSSRSSAAGRITSAEVTVRSLTASTTTAAARSRTGSVGTIGRLLLPVRLLVVHLAVALVVVLARRLVVVVVVVVVRVVALGHRVT